ncbi:MAG: EutN/CcmL family microcompartment protein [Deltaproteobacteria bacterium]|nr:EutN/CcmL family microcompartment protein [Deltaproteobacteria bacterium]
MILGRVVGQVWATRKNRWVEGKKLLIVRPLAWFRPDHECGHVVAVDPVGAEVGQDVVVCLGLPARRALGDARHPVEASIAAIVDRVEVHADAAADGGPRFEFAHGSEPSGLDVRP